MVARKDLNDFEIGMIVGVYLGGAPMTTKTQLADVSQATFQVTSVWNSEQKASPAKDNG